MKKRYRRCWSILAMIAGIASMASCSSFVKSFGKLPDGERLSRIEASPNYREGEFKYITPTSMFTGEASVTEWIKEMIFGPREGVRPSHALPMVKTNLKAIDRNKDVVVWLGHSSFYLQIDGKRILVDPVFSSHTSPISFIYKAFKGSYPYSAADMPELDALVVSHDHWDHLDYDTVMALKDKVKAVVTPLGVGSHFEYWGYDIAKIHEADWYQDVRLDPEFAILVTPARHFSGRGLKSNQTLWGGFVFETPHRKVFYSGDGGYGPHFAEVGQRFKDIDLAIVENGQYDPRWAQMHMMPEESLQAGLDVGAKALLPVHAGRFALASHNWDDPYNRIAAASEGKPIRLLTPEIGEVVDFSRLQKAFTKWWEESPAPVAEHYSSKQN
ncbi:MBL fold metallo-hydrolase [Pseudomonas sp. B2M1-30]|uniref:MBL fold metallo-hydrolase n=1 Tax=Pseudomonas TaxID=286 RepID=UPI0021C59B2B|nr:MULTISPECIES: MBL fold metallo-hydrolase [Pseudomonas]MCU0120528.1 MBL fold metallo-hydrolase [Pseudomonas sp. B2M1-30]MCU7262546.1 MBL fold metallo-hydrolase [Pseudomonas koreensis]